MAKKKVEAEEEKYPCFGAYDDDDESCTDCPWNEDCAEEAEALEEEEEEEEEEKPKPKGKTPAKKKFDPASVDVDNEERIEVLSELSMEELLAVADHYDIEVEEDADATEIIMTIDEHFSEEEEEEEEEKPKKKPAAKKKAPPKEKTPAKRKAPAKKVTKVVDEIRDDALASSADATCEIVEMVVDHSKNLLSEYGNLDHLIGIRDTMNDIINTLGKSKEEPEEEEKPKAKKKATARKAPAKGKGADVDLEDTPPAYFEDIANEYDLAVVPRPHKNRYIIKMGRRNAATVHFKRSKWVLCLDGRAPNKKDGTVPLAGYHNFASISAGNKNAEDLLRMHLDDLMEEE